MSKKFYKCNYTAFWTIAEQLPQDHIETILSNKGLDWEEINNNVEWDFPNNELRLVSTNGTQPTYIKCTDGENSFYFYYVGVNDLDGVRDGQYYFTQVYKLDEYMTVYFDKLQLVLQSHLKVLFVRKFYDRFIYAMDDQQILTSGTIDFYQQVQYMKNPTEPVSLVRNFVYGTTAQQLYDRNFSTSLQPSYSVTCWNPNGPARTIYTTAFSTPNHNNRFLYLVLKSSALINCSSGGANKKTFADNDKLIIPIIDDNVLGYLFNFDITQTYDALIDVSGGSMVGFYESEIPPSLLMGAWKYGGDPNITGYVGYESQTSSSHNDPVFFFKVRNNYAFTFNLLRSTDAPENIGISNRLKRIFQDAHTSWNPDTEPLFLSDNYYKEIHQIDQNNKLETTMSLLTINVSGGSFSNSGINIKSLEFFDSHGTSIYTYDNLTGTASNEQNPSWNSNKSNRITSLTLSGGLYDSASANYYASNSTTQFTSIQNRKSEETQAWVDFGADTAKSVISTATSFNVLNPVKSWGNVATTAINIAEQATNTALSQQRANRSLASSIQNIKSSPASTVSSPYVSICCPNVVHTDGSYLFNTYSLEVSDFDKRRVFTDIANNGYPTSEVDDINTFINRQFCNILHISTSQCQNQLWNLLINAPSGLFNNQIYNTKFIAWLNTPHMFYSENRLANHFNYDEPDYIPNIELVLPHIGGDFPDIDSLVDNHDLGVNNNMGLNIHYTETQLWQIITKNNPRLLATGLTLTDFTYVNDFKDGAESIIKLTPLPTIQYQGTITMYYIDGFITHIKVGDFPIIYRNNSTNVTTDTRYDKSCDMTNLTLDLYFSSEHHVVSISSLNSGSITLSGGVYIPDTKNVYGTFNIAANYKDSIGITWPIRNIGKVKTKGVVMLYDTNTSYTKRYAVGFLDTITAQPDKIIQWVYDPRYAIINDKNDGGILVKYLDLFQCHTGGIVSLVKELLPPTLFTVWNGTAGGAANIVWFTNSDTYYHPLKANLQLPLDNSACLLWVNVVCIVQTNVITVITILNPNFNGF